MITKAIIEEFHLDISNQYLDGTKIEANANKYKFVWKPTTFHRIGKGLRPCALAHKFLQNLEVIYCRSLKKHI